MIKLLKNFKRYKDGKREYYIEPKFGMKIDNEAYECSLIPTIVVQPYYARYLDVFVFEVWWLNIHIGIGLWKKKEIKENNNRT